MVCHVVQGDFRRDFFEVSIYIFNTAHFHSRSLYILILQGKVSIPNIQCNSSCCRDVEQSNTDRERSKPKGSDNFIFGMFQSKFTSDGVFHLK